MMIQAILVLPALPDSQDRGNLCFLIIDRYSQSGESSTGPSTYLVNFDLKLLSITNPMALARDCNLENLNLIRENDDGLYLLDQVQ